MTISSCYQAYIIFFAERYNNNPNITFVVILCMMYLLSHINVCITDKQLTSQLHIRTRMQHRVGLELVMDWTKNALWTRHIVMQYGGGIQIDFSRSTSMLE
jgi:hypothetical protein